MKKIAFVNQRYGKEVNGGSEYYTMQMAQKLKRFYDVEVLTSKALTYNKWEDYYSSNVEVIDGITVRRFGVRWKRNRILQRFFRILITRFGWNTQKITEMWNRILGPYVPGLIRYMENHKQEYQAVIFVTYMYYPTVFGMEKASERAIFVPTAHDEYNIYFKVYEKLFHLPKKIVYLTEEERKFVWRQFHNEETENRVIGLGVELPEKVSVERFRRKYGIEGEYLIYAGRVDADKGCGEMFEYFHRYVGGRNDLKLVVIGRTYMKIPDAENIYYLGYVSDEDKYDAIKGAKLLWLPSRMESLSIAVLEAMKLGTPVIVNGKCNVLRAHCEKSGAGLWYDDYEGFSQQLQTFTSSLYKDYSGKAVEYVKQYYSWDKVLQEWRDLLESI